jgi:hypothetical protein
MKNIDYGQILRRSWELTKRHKWLWVYGLVLSVFAGRGSGSGSVQLPSTDSLKDAPQKLPSDLPETSSQILGQATSAISEWFSRQPVSTWFLLAGIFLLLISFGIAVSWIIRSWAKGSLIAGLAQADNDQPTTLVNTSVEGLKKLKHLIIFSLISLGLGLAIILGLVLLGLIGYLVFVSSPTARSVWIVLIIAIGLLTVIVAFIILAMVGIYAERLIVLKNYSPWPAWKKGLSLSRHHLLHTILMSIINQVVGCLAGCLSLIVLMIVLGIPAVVLVAGLFKDGFQPPNLATIITLVIFFFVFLYANFLVQAVITVFKYSNWNLFFKQAMAEEEKHEPSIS